MIHSEVLNSLWLMPLIIVLLVIPVMNMTSSISDIALVNTSNQTLNFNEGGYPSVTVSAHGTAIQHMAAPPATTSAIEPL
jgi:hypothetical protein